MTKPILLEFPDELRGEKVVVRPYRAGDGRALWEAVEESRHHLRRWLPFADQHQTLEESEELVRRFSASWILRQTDITVGVWEIETGRFVGGSGLHRIDWDVRKFEIGYWVRASATGNGYITESSRLLCRFAFDVLEANRVSIRCEKENERSAAIPRRLGFELEGILRNEKLRVDGSLCDMMYWGMTRERWFGDDRTES